MCCVLNAISQCFCSWIFRDSLKVMFLLDIFHHLCPLCASFTDEQMVLKEISSYRYCNQRFYGCTSGLSFYSRLHINSLDGYNFKHHMNYEKICEGGILIDVEDK